MTIQIERKFGYMGYLGRVKLYANDEPIAKLAVGDTYTYEPGEGQGIIRLKVTQLGGGSNTLFLKDPAKVTISVNPYYTITFLLFFACLFAANITPYSIVFLPLALLLCLVFILLGFSKTFVLKEVSE
ncbi:hypothetical protein SAMN04489762_1517 [Terribacillus saccharophilus]|uniref:Uncharacterized protein n=1 Tax=Terribacillus saccharophilus TaxID=361277 RepID=A0AAX2EEH2_9BACI|nr:hypothetical protein [Terribacillus saccharophilus]MEC0289213.1 hypothetical protein [Terribacillus saccharophilus]SEM95920.1 hypothetical protein SAMN04489762_1517 [Terribacillus saccharophilus]